MTATRMRTESLHGLYEPSLCTPRKHIRVVCMYDVVQAVCLRWRMRACVGFGTKQKTAEIIAARRTSRFLSAPCKHAKNVVSARGQRGWILVHRMLQLLTPQNDTVVQ